MGSIVDKAADRPKGGKSLKNGESDEIFWDTEKAISETELVISDQNNAIKELRIEKDGESHRVFVKLTWRQGEFFLATTRSSAKPRNFKHLGRLVEHIEKTYLSVKSFHVQILK